MATKDSSQPENSSPESLPSHQLPEELFWEAVPLYQHEGFWLPRGLDTQLIQAIQEQFQARDDDVLLASPMKTGTTWLKALCYCIMTSIREGDDDDEVGDLLVKNNPHDCVPSLHLINSTDGVQYPFSGMPSPRLYHAHFPYSILPESIKNSSCKIVYIARNPKDTLVSLWHFYNKFLRPNQPAFPLEKAVDSFCRGVFRFGPFHEHVIQYWEESKRMPHRVLFLKYEELIRDPKGEVKRLASFLGRPFKDEDEVEKVLWRCSLGRLKELEVNKNGKIFVPVESSDSKKGIPNSAYFRLGTVGDWKNHLTQDMVERIDELTREKFEGTGLSLEAS
ncbi:hypothetical protein Tsubulata_048976 [Turnera subulata]|uniref:Sulfotransferase n=1 Tax=Turnera subulata TaxID=218843 RepID=A0A9Q0JCS3_9ROSI|nr:hypothetical protein Tsubulata_048976 [Turnera subulata]